jgi:hypothetical protein
VANNGRAIIRISALPDSALRRALSGVVDSARKTSRAVATEQAKAAKQGERAVAEAAKSTGRAAANAADEAIKQAKRAEREKIRAAERAAVAEQREVQKTARTQMREAERASKAQAKAAAQSSQRRRDIGAAVAGGVYGAVRGGVDLVQRGFGLAGMGSLEERLQTAGQFRATLIRSAGEAGASPEERKAVEEQLLKASESTNISILDLVQGLATAQTRFDKFKEFSANIEDIAKAAAATGEPIEALIGAMGTAADVFHLDAAGQKEFLDALISTSQRGTIGVGDISTTLAPNMGSFAIAGQRTGIAGAREFLATAQVAGTSQAGAAETGTKLNQMIRELNDVKVQAQFKQIGIDITKTGKPGDQLRNIGDIASDFATNEQFQRPAVRQALFTRAEGREGAEFLMTKLQSDPAFFKNLESSRTGAGFESVDKTLGQLKNDPLYHLQTVGIRAQTDTVRHADEIVAKITPAITELAKLQVRFPLLTESMSSLESAVRWAFGFVLANKMLGAAGGGMSGSAEMGEIFGKAASSSLGKNSSWLSKSAGRAGAVLGGAFQVAAAGFAAYELTSGALKATGLDKSIENLGSKLYDLFHPKEDQSRAAFRGAPPKSTTAKKEAKAAQDQQEDALGNFLSGGKPPITLPAGSTAAPEAKITLKVEGPASVTRVETTGFGPVEHIGDNGVRTLLP